ncbi:MAG: hypothetical protein SFV15_19305 [Polyangiaceae bacterium]|nr:hypothetical protein [Polyangiaceae bacterium]
MIETGYFLVADVLGFSAMITNTPAAQVDSRIGQWVSLVESAKARSGVARCSLFSDTVFAAASCSVEGLSAILSFSRELLSVGLENSFMVRGGMAHGTYTWGDLSYGRAIIDAHRLERRQNWIGVSCQGAMPHAKDVWGMDRIVAHLPPMKSGPMQVQPAVAWPIPEAQELTRLVMKSNAIRDGDLLQWEIGSQQHTSFPQLFARHRNGKALIRRSFTDGCRPRCWMKSFQANPRRRL